MQVLGGRFADVLASDLRRPGACVINISAPQAFNPTKFQAHVCAAKAGVDMGDADMQRLVERVDVNGDGVIGERCVPPTAACERCMGSVSRGGVEAGVDMGEADMQRLVERVDVNGVIGGLLWLFQS